MIETIEPQTDNDSTQNLIDSSNYFSPNSLTFYRGEDKALYDQSASWPEDAIEITAEQFKTYAQSAPPSGKQRGADENGQPCWVDLPKPTEDQKRATAAATIRSQRNELTDRTSREINRLEDAGQDASVWRQYRVALRNVPEQDGFPFKVKWPKAPGEFTGK